MRFWLLASGFLIFTAVSRASPFSVEPTIGMSLDYSSNPDLRADDANSENNAAVLINAPFRYDHDATQIVVYPSARFADARGYSSLASNFYRLDASAIHNNERGSVGLTGEFVRDSSLYHGGEAVRGVGVRRDTRAAGADWQRLLTPLIQAQVSVNWSRVSYEDNPSLSNLVDYKYTSAAPSFAFALNERNTLSVLGDVGHYESASGITSSKNYDVQLGLERQLSETWDLKAQAGYSKADNRYKYFFGPFYLGTIESQQRGTVYSASLTRKGETLTLVGSVSRALRPSGFAFLSRQDSADLNVNYTHNERWSFGARGAFQKSGDPSPTNADTSRRYFSLEGNATWRFDLDWSFRLRAIRVGQRYKASVYSGDSNGVSLEITREFHRADL